MSTTKQTFDYLADSRPFSAGELRQQIGMMTIGGVSGGRFVAHTNADGEVMSVSLPEGHGREVVVRLNFWDYYEVFRVLNGRVLGVETDVDCTQISESVYRAGMFVNVSFGADIKNR